MTLFDQLVAAMKIVPTSGRRVFLVHPSVFRRLQEIETRARILAACKRRIRARARSGEPWRG